MNNPDCMDICLALKDRLRTLNLLIMEEPLPEQLLALIPKLGIPLANDGPGQGSFVDQHESQEVLVCRECGGDNIGWDALVDRHGEVNAGPYDDAQCLDCRA